MRRLLADFTQKQPTKEQKFHVFHKFPIHGIGYEKCRLLRYVFAHFLRFVIDDQPMEKVNWEIPFLYKGHWCQCTHQKFGFRIYIDNELPVASAEKLFQEIIAVLEKAIEGSKPFIAAEGIKRLERGEIIISNRLAELENRYVFFREETKKRTQDRKDWKTFDFEKYKEFHFCADAAYVAFFSLLEHLCILGFGFVQHVKKEDLPEFCKQIWSDKFKQIFSLQQKVINDAYVYLVQLSRHKRNPTVHGYVDKMNTIFHFYSEDARHRTAMNIFDRELVSGTEDPEINFEKLDAFLTYLRTDDGTKRMMQYLDTEFDVAYDDRSLRTHRMFMSLDDAEAAEYLEHLSRKFDDAANMDW